MTGPATRQKIGHHDQNTLIAGVYLMFDFESEQFGALPPSACPGCGAVVTSQKSEYDIWNELHEFQRCQFCQKQVIMAENILEVFDEAIELLEIGIKKSEFEVKQIKEFARISIQNFDSSYEVLAKEVGRLRPQFAAVIKNCQGRLPLKTVRIFLIHVASKYLANLDLNAKQITLEMLNKEPLFLVSEFRKSSFVT